MIDLATEDQELDTYGNVTADQARKIRDMYIARRRYLGASQRDIAAKADISQAAVSKAERMGYMSMRAIDFLKLLNGYGIEPNDVAALLGLFQPKDEKQVDSLRLKTLIAGLRTLSDEDLTLIERVLGGLARK